MASLRGNIVSLNWKALSEHNIDYFEVERSTDNINYSKTGTAVDASGNTSSLTLYSYGDDISALFANGILYYRIKQYNKDGSFRYSNIAVIRVKDAGIKIWPHPFLDQINISYQSQINSVIELRFTDVNGKLIFKQRLSVNKGTNQLQLQQLQKLSAGIYFVQITDTYTNAFSNFKITKQ